MRKATATYVAPLGDNKVVEMGGITFFDGKSVEINSFDHPHLIEKLQGNQHFDIDVSKDDESVPRPKAKRGRPSKADIEAAAAEAVAAEAAAKIATEKAASLKKASEEAAKQEKSEAKPLMPNLLKPAEPKPEPVT